MNDHKFVRMQEKGQVTIPTEIRKKLGLLIPEQRANKGRVA
jgi:bifunctional DNA-binding transcriptional regulator/antitoxin component of YhaV-PrlF toxin-antitoxin module